MIDARNDIICTATIFISMIFMKLFEVNIDGYLSFLVSLFIIYSSIKLLKEVIDPLLGISFTPEQVELIKEEILSHKEVKGFHDLLIHSYGDYHTYASVHVEVEEKMSLLKAHEIMDKIEKAVEKKGNIYLTIHVDPLDMNDEIKNELHQKVKAALKMFDKDLSFHDFRVVVTKKSIKMIFDIIVPYEKTYHQKEILAFLHKALDEKDKKYYFSVRIEHPFY